MRVMQRVLFDCGLLVAYNRELAVRSDVQDIWVDDPDSELDESSDRMQLIHVFMVLDAQSAYERFVKSGTTLKVTPSLIHQMGNPGESNFFTLHVYGNMNLESGITNEARIFDYSRNELLFVNGGIFYLLPEDKIVRREDLPEADYATWSRDLIEAAKRAKTMGDDSEYRRLMREISSD